MADALSEQDANRIYTRVIRADALADLAPSSRRTAVIVGGQPGAGKAQAAFMVRSHLSQTAGAAVSISGDELREYHPHWRQAPPHDAHADTDVQNDVGRWVARLTADAIAAGVNITISNTMRDPRTIAALATSFKAAGYAVAAVVLATARDRSRQVTLARYDVARSAGLTARFVSSSLHDAAYLQLPQTLSQLEASRLIDRLQVIAPGGRQLYANELEGDRWKQPARGSAVLKDFRERRPTAQEQADSALRWQALAQHLSNDASVPREVASQAVAWSNEATEALKRDPMPCACSVWDTRRRRSERCPGASSSASSRRTGRRSSVSTRPCASLRRASPLRSTGSASSPRAERRSPSALPRAV